MSALMNPCMRPTGYSLRKMREKAGLTRELAAAELGCSYNTLFNYERGNTEPTVMTIKNMVLLYGCTSDELLEDE